MNPIQAILSERSIHALGWTIVHSLWQAALLALAFGILLLIMKRSSARFRYIAGIGTLLLMVLLSAITFYGKYRSYSAEQPAAILPETTLSLVQPVGGETAQYQPSVTVIAWFETYFSRHLPLVVTLWLLGFLVSMFRLTGGFFYNQRLKSYQTKPSPALWQQRLRHLCKQMNITCNIKLQESHLAKFPLTIGFFKPVILFPIGMISGLPRYQVEAVIAHELAHILRRDYFFNLLQSVADVLFFYHPGIRWISSQIRHEREHCCDDIAVTVTGDSLKYARALTSLEAMIPHKQRFAPAATGTGTHLLQRIRRLLVSSSTASSKGTRILGGTAFAICMLALFLSAASGTGHTRSNGMVDGGAQQPAQKDKKITEMSHRELLAAYTVLQQKKSSLNASDKERLMQIQERIIQLELQERKNRQEELKRITEEKTALEERLKTLIREQKTRQKQQAIEEEKKHAELLAQTAEKSIQMQEQEKLNREEKEKRLISEELLKKQQDELAKTIAEEQRFIKEQEKRLALELAAMRKKIHEEETALEKMLENEIQDQKQLAAEEQLRQQKLTAEISKAELELQKQQQRVETELRSRINELKELQEKEMQRIQEEQETELKKLQEQAEVEQARVEAGNRAFMNELTKDKLISDDGRFELKLTTRSLYINGRKQPDKFLKKYLDLYREHFGESLKSGRTLILNNN